MFFGLFRPWCEPTSGCSKIKFQRNLYKAPATDYPDREKEEAKTKALF